MRVPLPPPPDPSSRGWRPAIVAKTHYGHGRPPVGILIGHRGQAYRVVRVEDVNPGNWSERAREQWLAEKMPDPWRRAPYRVVVKKADAGPDLMMTVEPWMYVDWHELPEHYAVCVACGDPAPCAGHTQAKQAEWEMERAEREMSVLPGCCPACHEPISTRQKVHTFPGANLLNPLGESDVRFHQRRQCRSGAQRYEEMWVQADPTRPRSLLTLRCEGFVTVHADGSGECHGRQDGSDCPTIYARHTGRAACYLMTHGCGLGCTPDDHPGTRLAPGLTDHGHRPKEG